uniref:Uncharacterized protein n=1 Tax=Strigamia maritima TaxID=126957 RepID=T1IHV0_STRMM
MHDSSEDKTIFLRRVGLNFQVSPQKSPQPGINWTSRLVPEGHPAADASASARFSKTGSATIQKLPHYEGRGITRFLTGEEDNLQASRSEKEVSTEDSSIMDEVDIPISEDSPAFQVIPFLPEDAVFKEQQQSNIDKNWQSVTMETEISTVSPAVTSTEKITVSSNDFNKSLKNDPIDIISRIHLEASSKSEIVSTESYLSRWVPIRLEDPLTHTQNKEINNKSITSSKSASDFEEEADEFNNPTIIDHSRIE